MTPLATVFYWVVGGELTLCLIVLAVMFIRRLYNNYVASKYIRMMDAEDWMGWDEEVVNEEIEHNERVDKR